MKQQTNNSLSAQWAEALSIGLDDRSRYLRRLVVEALEGGNRGHIGSSMSPIEILRVLYDDVMRYRSDQPDWEGRDRFILSKGHGCLALYALLVDKGFFPREALSTFCCHEGVLGGHPDFGKVPGVEASTGALGHGLSIGVGFALSARIKKLGSRVFVLLGDGEINEGSVWEAAMSAAHHRLDNLVAVVDYNKLQSYGPTAEVMNLEPLLEKWRSFGFCALEVNGHDVVALQRALAHVPQTAGQPTALIAHTIKGKGISFAENRPEWHHKSNFKPQDIQDLYSAIGHA